MGFNLSLLTHSLGSFVLTYFLVLQLENNQTSAPSVVDTCLIAETKYLTEVTRGKGVIDSYLFFFIYYLYFMCVSVLSACL